MNSHVTLPYINVEKKSHFTTWLRSGSNIGNSLRLDHGNSNHVDNPSTTCTLPSRVVKNNSVVGLAFTLVSRTMLAPIPLSLSQTIKWTDTPPIDLPNNGNAITTVIELSLFSSPLEPT